MKNNNMIKFYNNLNDLEVRQNNIANARTELKNIIDEFHTRISNNNAIQIPDSKFKENMETFNSQISTEIKNWNENFAAWSKNEEFQSELKNSFIVMLYGKVNAGKSTFLQFLIDHKDSKQDVSITVYDKKGNKSIKYDTCLKIDSCECTDDISVIKIGAMALVDTPGLGSLTKENEQLAREYIQNADFVVFLTPSESSMHLDEVEKIKELVNNMQKNASIVLTCSDDIEKDQIGDKEVEILVNYSHENRQLLENQARELLKKEVNLDNIIDIISISALAAKKGSEENNDELYDNSNLEKFYDMMNEQVLVKAQKLKSISPLALLYGLTKQILTQKDEGVESLKNSLSVLKQKHKERKIEIGQMLNSLKYEISNIIYDITSSYESSINSSNAINMFSSIEKEIHDKIINTVDKKTDTILWNFLNNDINEFVGSKRYHITEKYETFKVARNNGSVGGIAGGVAGTSIGLVAGGPLGALVGFGLGMLFGGAIGRRSKSYETYKERIGDNKQEIINSFIADRINYYNNSYLPALAKYIDENYANTIDDILYFYDKEITMFEEKIKTIKSQFKGKL